jgi:hypothetical protein
MSGSQGNLFRAHVGSAHFVEPVGEFESGLTRTGTAIPCPVVPCNERRNELEEGVRVSRPKLRVARRYCRKVVPGGPLRRHRTTATATPSCVGTMIPSTRGSLAIRRLNSRTALVFSSDARSSA